MCEESMHSQRTRGLGEKTKAALALVKRKGLVSPRDLAAEGLPPSYLTRLSVRGLIEHVGRGLYAWPGLDLGENQSLAEVARLAPKGVICLLSALQFHRLTTQTPHDIWLALPPATWRPRSVGLKLRVFRFSGKALTYGIETHPVGGSTLRVYGPAKTVVDCFKFRNKVGLDVALEALRDGLHKRLFTTAELWEAARIVRMQNVMRPYLEAIV
jgi:predicted transcriptional regulator of viral defense system